MTMTTTTSKPKRSSKKSKGEPQPDLLSTYTNPGVTEKRGMSTWLLATNHQNALYMIAAGLVMGPTGFRGKHYTDTLSTYPGWAPLFRGQVPAQALSQATSEGKHLKACILLLDQAAFHGDSRLLSNDGVVRDGKITDDLQESDVAVFLRTPLPITSLIRVAFKSKEDQADFEASAADVGNVDLADVSLEIDSALFDERSETTWPPEQATFDDLDRSPALGQAVGGMLAMLYHGAHRSDTAVAALRVAFGDGAAADQEILARDPVLKELPTWLDNHAIPESGPVPARLFWGVVQAVVQAQETGSTLKPIDKALSFLEAQLASPENQAYRSSLEKLIQDMRSTLGFSDSTITELLERRRGSLSRPLLLFCLRNNCEELLAFSHPLLSDSEFVLASVLFGARDGWLRLPSNLKQPRALGRAITYRMAAIDQHDSGSGLSFEPMPKRPVAVRELFADGVRGWKKSQQKAALELARNHKWIDCIQTRIALGTGEYRLVVQAGGIALLVDGEVKAVEAEVEQKKFMQLLGTGPLDEPAEASIRGQLEGKV